FGAVAQERVPRYPGAKDVALVPLADDGKEVSYFTTRDPPDQVARFYAEHFERAGYPISLEPSGEAGWVVAAFSTRDARQLAIVVRREGEVTLAFRVERHMESLAQLESLPLVSPIEQRPP